MNIDTSILCDLYGDQLDVVEPMFSTLAVVVLFAVKLQQ